MDTPSSHSHRHRQLSEKLLHAPYVLRALVRADEIWLTVLAAFVGCVTGGCVSFIYWLTQWMHEVIYALPAGGKLSAAPFLEPSRAVLGPIIGGVVVGLALLMARYVSRQATVDPIEANALHGGRMSMTTSLHVTLQTILSNGFGASVGLEAGYTQIGSAIASRLGRSFRLRRNDLRILVGCGAAGAIGAAFNAPLTGAFYAFELVIGVYSLATLAPVVTASIMAVLTDRLLTGGAPGYHLQIPLSIPPADYPPLLALSLLAALVGIALMRGVTLMEALFTRSHIPYWGRPTLGGIALGLMALITPQVLSSGHSALHMGIDAPYTLSKILMLLVLKAIASAISIGSGFRGGLFFASLFLGGMLGKAFGGLLLAVSIPSTLPSTVFALVGMGALAVAVVGGPLTMSFLVLETTGSLPITVAVLAGTVISSLTVRRLFGYSFTTWRFHLRGEAIRSAVDIGWMRNLTVGRMMRKDIRTVCATITLERFRRDYPLGSSHSMIVVDERNRYLGMILLAEAHASETDAACIGDLLHFKHTVLTPDMTVKKAIETFEQAEADSLAVVEQQATPDCNHNSPGTGTVLGLLTEAYALRRYSEELDQRRRELSGGITM
ncbi:chloride channel protein [Granulibacter bethesdensis]|uniref:Chloride channel protein n=1 Tax=Granulibacter bethesdensis (strain ATCC BAA-1260 / CGDNIH1) TaxID=391165 RepID=Q0BSF4_GRABC|nr:chloride channel protein [Granulibacter bethesdensis]ABI62248.1 Chloride channel protein [Granulibacter bethesdensis CGDNIH1]APH52074.1 Chloride channel protein [Granulibacter bethesdensis]APH64765.1 Chloride channel protein [Granulibacter bethesdensis]